METTTEPQLWELDECPECGTDIPTNFCRECDPCVMAMTWGGYDCTTPGHDHEPTPDELARYINPEARYP